MEGPTKDIKIIRVYDAALERVWNVWTKAENIAKWFSPFPGVDAHVHECDVRVGGCTKITVDNPQGGSPLTFILNYKSVEPNNEIAFTVKAAENGPESPVMKAKFIGEHDDQTRMLFESPEVPRERYDDASQGWHTFFDKIVQA